MPTGETDATIISWLQAECTKENNATFIPHKENDAIDILP